MEGGVEYIGLLELLQLVLCVAQLTLQAGGWIVNMVSKNVIFGKT